MKRFFLITILAVLVISFSSCRKDFTCTCSKIYKNSTGSNVRNYSVKTYRDTRNAAKEKCKLNTDLGSDDLGNYSLNCEIEC